MFDNMHVLDLGVTLHIIANTLFTIVMDMGKRNREANFDQVWLRLSNIYKKHDIKPQLTRLRWKQVVKDPNAPFADYPSLRSVKAAEARALLKACVVLAHEHLDDSDETKFRHGLCQAMADVYMMLEGSRYTIDDYKSSGDRGTTTVVQSCRKQFPAECCKKRRFKTACVKRELRAYAS